MPAQEPAPRSAGPFGAALAAARPGPAAAALPSADLQTLGAAAITKSLLSFCSAPGSAVEPGEMEGEGSRQRSPPPGARREGSVGPAAPPQTHLLPAAFPCGDSFIPSSSPACGVFLLRTAPCAILTNISSTSR